MKTNDLMRAVQTCANVQQVSATDKATFFPKCKEELGQESSIGNKQTPRHLSDSGQAADFAMSLSAHSLFCMHRRQTRNLHWSHTIMNLSASQLHSSQSPPPIV
jgi:hypothetical protein